MSETKRLKRFWVTSNGKARGGWIVASVLVDKNGVESDGPIQTGFTTKKEAERISRNLNQELANSAASAIEPCRVCGNPKCPSCESL